MTRPTAGPFVVAACQLGAVGAKRRRMNLTVVFHPGQSRPVPGFHSLAVPSQLPVASWAPSGLNAATHTASSCRIRASSRPVPVCHSRAKLSVQPVAGRR